MKTEAAKQREDDLLASLDDHLSGDMAKNLTLYFEGSPDESAIVGGLCLKGQATREPENADGKFWFKLTHAGVKRALQVCHERAAD